MHGVYFNLDSECDDIRFYLFDDYESAIAWMYNWLRENEHVRDGQELDEALEEFQNNLGMMEYFHDYPVTDMRSPPLRPPGRCHWAGGGEVKTPPIESLYSAVDWLGSYEPAPGEDASGIEEVRLWLTALANKANEKQFRAEVRKQAIEQYASENGVKPRDVRAALKRLKDQGGQPTTRTTGEVSRE